MNVEIGTEAPIFLFWEYLFQIFGILSLQCGSEGDYYCITEMKKKLSTGETHSRKNLVVIMYCIVI
jgi:hypothetical protein